MNSITIAGRVGRDGELKQLQTGHTILTFPVASSRKTKDGEVATWFECTMWGNRAEVLAQYVKKGGQVTVTGSCELDIFPKNDGTPGAKIKVNVNDVALQGGPTTQGQAPQQQQPAQQPQRQQPGQGAFTGRAPAMQQGFAGQAPAMQPAPAPAFDDFDDDIPF